MDSPASDSPPLPRLAEGLVCVLAVGIIGVFDFLTGLDVAFSLFYLVPVGWASWRVSRFFGMILAVGGAGAWRVADQFGGHAYANPWIPWWNSFAELLMFALVAALFSGLRRELELHQRLALEEPLTGLANRRAFYEAADREIIRCRRYRHPFSLTYIDIDYFKNVNDRFGHPAGDELLRILGRILRKDTRATDVAARLGGDEFALLLPETGAEAAAELTKKVRDGFRAEMQKRGWPATLSSGVVTFTDPPVSPEEMLREADRLMYAAKRAGRDRTEMGAPGRPEAPLLPA